MFIQKGTNFAVQLFIRLMSLPRCQILAFQPARYPFYLVNLGTVHFLRGELGGGLTEKKNGLKGGPSKKKKGGHVKYFSSGWYTFYYS